VVVVEKGDETQQQRACYCNKPVMTGPLRVVASLPGPGGLVREREKTEREEEKEARKGREESKTVTRPTLFCVGLCVHAFVLCCVIL